MRQVFFVGVDLEPAVVVETRRGHRSGGQDDRDRLGNPFLGLVAQRVADFVRQIDRDYDQLRTDLFDLPQRVVAVVCDNDFEAVGVQVREKKLVELGIVVDEQETACIHAVQSFRHSHCTAPRNEGAIAPLNGRDDDRAPWRRRG